jgi:ferredoxin
MSADHVQGANSPRAAYPIEVEIPRGGSLLAGLADHGVEFPCGGTALCGGCGVRVLAGSLDITGPDRAVFTP